MKFSNFPVSAIHYKFKILPKLCFNEETFQKKQITYTLFSGQPFFDRKEIKDSLSYLRMI